MLKLRQEGDAKGKGKKREPTEYRIRAENDLLPPMINEL
jgi:hypothetical protein